MVRDEHDRDALLAAQALDGVNDLAPALRVEHRRRLVEHDALRAHGDHARDGDALLLPAGEQVRRVRAVFIHPHLPQRLIDAAANFIRRDAEVFRRERHVLLDHVRDDLVVRVLKHHADAAPDLQQQRLILRIHAPDVHATALRQQNGVKMLGERGLSAPVVPQHRHKAPLLDREVEIVKHNVLRLPLSSGIAVMQMLHADGGA